MSYDIYGEILRSGHCEVHPHIHEPYPCSLCLADDRRREDDRRAEREYERQINAEYERYCEEMFVQHCMEEGGLLGLA